MTTRELLLSEWNPGIVLPVGCALAFASYLLRSRSPLGLRAGWFALAIGIFFVALASPLGLLARGYLFSAHMLQHLLLMLAVPPLLLLGFGEPAARRRAPARHRSGWQYVAPWAAGVAGMWVWHAPTLCNAAASSPTVQTFQTLSLPAMGLTFWWPVLAPTVTARMAPFPTMLYLFAACLACTLLGIVVTLAPVEVCRAYLHPPDPAGVLALVRDRWGLSCRADQELGGLLMWVPSCFVYASAILATLGRYYRAQSASGAPVEATP